MNEPTLNPYAGYDPTQVRYPPATGDDPPMKDKAAESAQAGKEGAAEVAQTAAEQAKEVAAEAKTQAKNVVSEARDQLRSHAADQHRNAVTNLRSVADELRSMASGSGQGGLATDLVGQAAGRTQTAADWLDGRQPEDLLGELRRFARRRPGAFLLGALAAGVVAGRLTRGAVAVHSDDSQGDAGIQASGETVRLQTPVAPSAPPPPPVQPYAPVGSGGYGPPPAGPGGYTPTGGVGGPA